MFNYDFLEPYLTPDYPNTLDIKEHYLYIDHVNDASLCLVFKGPVARTKKTTKTRLNATKCNQTTGCGCSILKIKRPEKDWFILTGFNQLQPVF